MNDSPNLVEVAILGGGFSGLGLAIELIRRGRSDFVILEKADQLGGTWRENTYPGCACDVPSQLYSFSYAPKADWSRVFAPQAEIQAYLLQTAERSGVMPHVRLHTAVLGARWDAERALWVVRTTKGEWHARFVVSAQGPLHEPRLPDVPGLDTFEGTHFHSARWRHDADLEGKRVAVVGNGSSAIQFVPEIAGRVGSLTLFQRTPAWVLPKPDHAIAGWEARLFSDVPGFQKAYRATIYGLTELLQLAERSPDTMRRLQRLAEWQLQRQVTDPELRARLTPDFALGCKRLLLSNTFYPAITRPNVNLVSHAIAEVTATGVVDAAGVHHEADVLIFATGFHVTDSSAPAHLLDHDGRSLARSWGGTPKAYLGTSVAGFPNLFLMLGPNLGNGHGSAHILIEAQASYIAQAIEHAERTGARALEVRPEVSRSFNEQVQAGLEGTVWNAGGCNSWYLDGNGVNSTIYPWTTIDLRRRMRRFDATAFHVHGARPSYRPTPIELHGAVVAITGGARGIGLATARAFLDAGARVAIGDLDELAARGAARELGPKARAFCLDVRDRGSLEAFVQAVTVELGEIDVFVNNAGIMPTGPFLDGLMAQPPEDVAAAVVGSVSSRAPEITVPGLWSPLPALYGLVPRRLLGRISPLLGAGRLRSPLVAARRAVYERTSVAQDQSSVA